ncbi:hypothetical protein ACFYPT_25755 [Streptomyces sp. NPDC005529]|uniref:hypothetical protein n=2 Tax=Streptomyces TaxID=1883 RepID=UPI0033ACD180
MPLHVFLNQLSCASECGSNEVAEGMRTFVGVLRQLQRLRGISLATQNPFDGTVLAQGYYYAQWRNDAHNKEEALYFQRMRDRCVSFTTALQTATAQERDDIWLRFKGGGFLGLRAALMADGLALSLPLAQDWDAAWLDLDIEELPEGPEPGETVADEYTDKVRHTSRKTHLAEDEKWILREGLDRASSGAEL